METPQIYNFLPESLGVVRSWDLEVAQGFRDFWKWRVLGTAVDTTAFIYRGLMGIVWIVFRDLHGLFEQEAWYDISRYIGWLIGWLQHGRIGICRERHRDNTLFHLAASESKRCAAQPEVASQASRRRKAQRNAMQCSKLEECNAVQRCFLECRRQLGKSNNSIRLILMMYKKGQLQEKGSTWCTSITSNFKWLAAKGYLFGLCWEEFALKGSDSAVSLQIVSVQRNTDSTLVFAWRFGVRQPRQLF